MPRPSRPREQTALPRVPDEDSIGCAVVNLCEDVSGMECRVETNLVVDDQNGLWLQFAPGVSLDRLDGCWVLIPYFEANGRERCLNVEFVYRWHERSPGARGMHVGGRLKIVDDHLAADVLACCQSLRTLLGHPFRHPD
jgi:hypothetical protein